MAKHVPRQRKHKVRQREEQQKSRDANAGDTNVEQVLPLSQAEREERKRKLREELRSQQTKISSKKQKRLDKYIENKLKKEENLELLKKLAAAKVDTTGLQSSRHLGRSKDRAFDVPKEQKAAVPIRKRGRDNLTPSDSEESDFEDDNDTGKEATASAAAPPSTATTCSLGRRLEVV
ncbi:putative ATP-dependent RNA helicase DHR1 [Ascosphaera atra]|nr:putative ATP-dependent RNA helicase DHR1 [Ascosphaera atra]